MNYCTLKKLYNCKRLKQPKNALNTQPSVTSVGTNLAWFVDINPISVTSTVTLLLRWIVNLVTTYILQRVLTF